ncbi:MFS transporter [Rhodococcus sp. TAF43]|uniref:MFS transporter n=1 Tax=unclassified Rhodococcus (in: high G+C Gram-positive bacteria) TaxID=192944 RepID=UPI0015827955|nr:MFS transporter [Rhodococcus sp. W8901]QKT10797.1 MFS transporter [Rhodococcus sp. W8901]
MPRNETRPPGTALTATLCFVILVASVQQTIVIPLSGVIGHQLDVDTTAIGWTLTASFLAAAVTTPIAGRMADLRRKRTVLLGVLVIVLVGSIIGAVTESLPWLLVARVLQGLSFAAFPVSIAILRDEFTPKRLTSAMGLLSGTLGFGGAIGMVLTGLLVSEGTDYRRVFWLATGMTIIALVGVVATVPSRPNPTPGRVDWAGAALLGAGLVLLLMPLAEGVRWGWTSPATIGCAFGGLVVLGVWFALERRIGQPLVPTEMLTRRPVLFTHLAGLLVGAGMFVNVTAVMYFVQSSLGVAGYGFDADPMRASVMFILPGATVGVIASICSGMLITRFGPRSVMAAASVLGVLGFGSMIVAHEHAWQVVCASMLMCAFTSLSYASLPALLVAEVEPGLTGVANSVNSIARTVGSSVASALLATLLTTHTAAGVATVDAYLIAFAIGAGCAVAATLLVFLATAKSHRRRQAGAEAAPVG